MSTIGIIGGGEVGSQIARAAIASGYEIVIANSRSPAALSGLVAELGPSARAATAAGAAEAGNFVVAVPLKLVNDMPVEQLAGKICSTRTPTCPDAMVPSTSSTEVRRRFTSFGRSSSTTVRSPSPGAAVRANRRGLRTNTRPSRS